jgi:hypothetical protein
MSPFLQHRLPTNVSRPRVKPRLCPGRHVSQPALRLGLALVICCSVSVSAQDSTVKRDSSTLRRDGWIFGPSIGVPTAVGEVSPELITVGFNLTRLDPGHLGADLSLGTLPRALVAGFVAFGIRGDAAYPVSVSSNMLLYPAAGLSMVGVGSSDGGGGLVGINEGLAAVFYGNAPIGLRIGVTAHQFLGTTRSIFLLEAGLVHVPRLEP